MGLNIEPQLLVKQVRPPKPRSEGVILDSVDELYEKIKK